MYPVQRFANRYLPSHARADHQFLASCANAAPRVIASLSICRVLTRNPSTPGTAGRRAGGAANDNDMGFLDKMFGGGGKHKAASQVSSKSVSFSSELSRGGDRTDMIAARRAARQQQSARGAPSTSAMVRFYLLSPIFYGLWLCLGAVLPRPPYGPPFPFLI